MCVNWIKVKPRAFCLKGNSGKFFCNNIFSNVYYVAIDVWISSPPSI